MKLVPVPPGEPPAPPMRLRSMLPDVPECPEGWEPYFAKHDAIHIVGMGRRVRRPRVGRGRADRRAPGIDRGDEQNFVAARSAGASPTPDPQRCSVKVKTA
eukprot:682849-Prymnesium_polylepis.1